jgi:cyclophilin family peptidyl-prolyl cis-trans isomerase
MRLVVLGIVGICIALVSVGLRAGEEAPEAPVAQPPPAVPAQPQEAEPQAPAATQPATTQPAAETQPATTQPANVVVIETSMGDITIELTPDRTPVTVENFLQYVDDGHYDGTIFHRVIRDFMIQGGGYTPDLREKKTREPIRNESREGLDNTRGTIAMARLNDPHSATAQFYINHADNPNLNHGGPFGGYAVFGRVTEGMDVVDRIANVRTMQRPPRFPAGLPREPVEIRTIRRK